VHQTMKCIDLVEMPLLDTEEGVIQTDSYWEKLNFLP